MNKLTIVGNGKMASSLISGLCDDYKITVLGRDADKLSKLTHKYPKIYTSLINNYDISNQNVILCVKPYALKDVALQLKGRASNLFSILASVKISNLHLIESDDYYRVMPNVSTKYGQSITSIYSQSSSNKKAINDIFSKVGSVVWAESEEELDLVTALCSSGVAFLALVAESLSDGVVKEGMNREKSFEYIAGLFESFSTLLKHKESYFDIKNNVMSPAGTTADGYYQLEKNNTRASFMDAIIASCKKAKSIS